jgi:hypothetical protein
MAAPCDNTRRPYEFAILGLAVHQDRDIGCRRPNSDHVPDGSLDIQIQAASPGPDKQANRPPTLARGEFNMVIRNYWPKEAALDGSYKNPPTKKVQ